MTKFFCTNIFLSYNIWTKESEGNNFYERVFRCDFLGKYIYYSYDELVDIYNNLTWTAANLTFSVGNLTLYHVNNGENPYVGDDTPFITCAVKGNS